MAKYKVLNAFELGGVEQAVGTELELTAEQVDNFGIANLEEVKEPVPSKYKVLESFELSPAVEAVTAEVDSVVELSDARAAELGDKVVEKVTE